MKEAMEQVTEFHRAFGHPVNDSINLGDRGRTKDLRVRLIKEEVEEYIEAEENDDMVGIADAFADIIYVICGAALTYGIPLTEIFDEVHRSNMTKFTKGWSIREDGKVLKGEGYEPPRIREIIERAVGGKV